MGGTQARLALGNGTPSLESVGDASKGLPQREMTRQAMHQNRNLLANDLDGSPQRAVRVVPTGEQEQPMLHQHAQQFGIQFTHDAFRLLRLPLIDLAQVFPDLPQQFNLPDRKSVV